MSIIHSALFVADMCDFDSKIDYKSSKLNKKKYQNYYKSMNGCFCKDIQLSALFRLLHLLAMSINGI